MKIYNCATCNKIYKTQSGLWKHNNKNHNNTISKNIEPIEVSCTAIETYKYIQDNNIIQKTIAQVIKEFISADLFSKRSTIIQLLVKQDKHDNQYLAYLLYDLLSNDKNGSIDTIEQTILFDSFPW